MVVAEEEEEQEEGDGGAADILSSDKSRLIACLCEEEGAETGRNFNGKDLANVIALPDSPLLAVTLTSLFLPPNSASSPQSIGLESQIRSSRVKKRMPADAGRMPVGSSRFKDSP